MLVCDTTSRSSPVAGVRNQKLGSSTHVETGVPGETPGQAALLAGSGSAIQALRLEKIGLPVLSLSALTHEKMENNLCNV